MDFLLKKSNGFWILMHTSLRENHASLWSHVENTPASCNPSIPGDVKRTLAQIESDPTRSIYKKA